MSTTSRMCESAVIEEPMEIDVSNEFKKLIAAARLLSRDAGDTVQEILAMGLERPLPREEARALLTRVVDVMRERAKKRGDAKAQAALAGNVDAFIDGVIAERERIGAIHKP